MGTSSSTADAADRADQELRRIALAYPGTSEHFPWGHRTIKVKDKAFVFMGVENGGFFFTAKLPDSRHVALLLPFAAPTGYGLGKSGWVSANFAKGEEPPVEMLASWLDESYRAIAPKKLVAGLPAGGVVVAAPAVTAKKPAAKATKKPAAKATKKPAAKKPAAKKPAAKKPAAKKPAAKATKKPAAKATKPAATKKPSRS